MVAFASERSAGQRDRASTAATLECQAADRGVDPGPRPGPLLGRAARSAPSGRRAGRGRRGRRRQHQLLAHARRRAAGRRRGQPRRRRRTTRASSPTPTARRCRWWSRWRRSTAPSGSSASSSPPTRRSPAPASGRSRSCATQSQAVLARRAEPPPPQVYPHQIAFNVLPQVETFKDGDDYTTEERKVMAETRKILGLGEDGRHLGHLRPGAGRHAATRSRSTSRRASDLSPEDCRELLAEAPGRDRRSTTPAPASTRWRSTPPAATRSSSAGSAATPARALPQPLGRRRQPAQGRGDQRRPGRRAAPRARSRSGPGGRFAELAPVHGPVTHRGRGGDIFATA